MALMRYEIIKLAQIINYYNIKTCLMLGVQSLLTSLDQIESDFRTFNILYDSTKFEELRKINHVNAIDVLKLIGNVQCVDSMDYSDYEGANIIFDLNSPVETNKYVGHYDLVIDGGTLEHVYNVSNAINNMNIMVAEKGLIYHMLPCSGWVNHGFYSFSPTFFDDTYSNISDFILIENVLCMKQPKGQRDRLIFSADCRFMTDWEINQLISEHAFGGVLVSCIARKNKVSCTSFEPQQGMYRDNLWIRSTNKEINYERILKFIMMSKSVYLYGAGNICKKLMRHLIKNDLLKNIAGIFDSNIELHGKEMYGKLIRYPSNDGLADAKVILICSINFEKNIEEFLESKKYNGQLVKLSEI